MAATMQASAPASLKEELTKALPEGFVCKYRYIRTPSKHCEPLFSALPGSKPEKTLLSYHFLTVGVNPASLPSQSDKGSAHEDVLSLAIEVFVYTTTRLVTVFVSKIDSTPYLSRHRPSPIPKTATTFLKWLADEQIRRRPDRKIVVSLFARAQAQYLFPGSSTSKDGSSKKHVLDDRQLIKWWARVLDPMITPSSQDEPARRYQAYMTVPGYEGTDLKRSFFPAKTSDGEHWQPGHPLLELARVRGLPEHAPPRCLLPRFPDDPKARYISELDEEVGMAEDAPVTVSPSKRKSGRWSSVRDLRGFWEAMEFRQECSSGRVVGFLWLVISPAGSEARPDYPDSIINGDAVDSQESVMSIPASQPILRSSTVPRSARSSSNKSQRRPLTGPIIARVPRLKGGSSSLSNLSTSSPQLHAQFEKGIAITKEGYEKAMQTLLNLDFGDLSIATRSTEKWISEVINICGLPVDFAVSIVGTAKADQAVPNFTGNNLVNNLSGMVKKKRKAVEDAHISNGQDDSGTKNEQPAVNLLGAGIVRKRSKPAS